MLAVLQRVSEARVIVDGETVGVTGQALYEHFIARARAAHPVVESGRFAADMKVQLVNDGPVTIPLRIVPPT